MKEMQVSDSAPIDFIESELKNGSLLGRNEDLMYRVIVEKRESWKYSEYVVQGVEVKTSGVIEVDDHGEAIFGEIDGAVIEVSWSEYLELQGRDFRDGDLKNHSIVRLALSNLDKLRSQEEIKSFSKCKDFASINSFVPVTTIPEIMQRARKYPNRWVPVRLDAPNGNIATKIKKDARASSEYEARSIKLDNGKFRIEARYRKSQTESTYEMYLKIREALNTSAASVLKDNLLEKTAQHIAERMTGK